MLRIWIGLFISSFAFAADWGSAVTGKDSLGHWFVVLENQNLRCRYSWKPINVKDAGETFMTELLIKSIGQNQAAASVDSGPGRIDACAWRYQMTDARVIYEGNDRRTVSMTWHHRNDLVPEQQVSIFPNAPVLKIEYIRYGVNIVDIANPGEGENPRYAFFGGDKWKRDYLLYPKGYYYPKADTHVVRMTGMPGDDGPGPLSYKGHFIMTVFNEKSGVGYGRVVPVDAIPIIKLLQNKGFELFPYYRQEKKPYTGYIYTFTGGMKEGINTGKMIVDGKLP